METLSRPNVVDAPPPAIKVGGGNESCQKVIINNKRRQKKKPPTQGDAERHTIKGKLMADINRNIPRASKKVENIEDRQSNLGKSVEMASTSKVARFDRCSASSADTVEPTSSSNPMINADLTAMLCQMLNLTCKSESSQMTINEATTSEVTTRARKTKKKQGGAKKTIDKRDYLFALLPSELRYQIQMDEVAMYSVTDMKTANLISETIVNLFPEEDAKKKIVVTDGTACVGGNSLSFCQYFRHVNVVESDLNRFNMLRHNLCTMGFLNLSCYHASYLNVLHSLYQDVVFLDPPWGGPGYAEYERLELFLDDV
jgi:hypothetical protein